LLAKYGLGLCIVLVGVATLGVGLLITPYNPPEKVESVMVVGRLLVAFGFGLSAGGVVGSWLWAHRRRYCTNCGKKMVRNESTRRYGFSSLTGRPRTRKDVDYHCSCANAKATLFNFSVADEPCHTPIDITNRCCRGYLLQQGVISEEEYNSLSGY